MAIVDKQQDKYGRSWGYDDEAEEWIKLDTESEQGSTVGNLLRGASRSAEGIGLGIEELVGGQPNTDARIKDLEERQARAGRSAPVAEAIGGAVPDIGAGLGVGLATGGAGFLPMLAGEAGLGALMGGLRPGATEDRLGRAALGAGFGAAGGAIGAGVGPAIRRAVDLYEGIAGRSAARVTSAIQSGADDIQRARRLAAGGGAEEGTTASGGRSIGAAETPRGALADDFVGEGEALEQTEAAGAGRSAEGVVDRVWRPEVEDMGYKSPAHAGSRSWAGARFNAAADELTPDFLKEATRADNQKLFGTKVSQALGIGERTKIEMPDLADAEEAIGQVFQTVEKELPSIGAKDYADVFRNLAPKKGLYGASPGEKAIREVIEKAEARGDSVLGGEDIMADRSRMSGDMANFYKNGREADGERLRQALERLDDKIEETARKRKRGDVADKYRQARQQWQLYRMVAKPGVVTAQGDINPVALRRAMAANKSSGGFGKDGPDRMRPELRDVWKIANVAAADETGVPMTGARLLARYGKSALPAAGLLGGVGAGVNTIWGN